MLKHGRLIEASDVVLEARPWPRGSSRTKFCVLVLGLMGAGLGLGLRILALNTSLIDANIKYIIGLLSAAFDKFTKERKSNIN
jgi:hypothetical protein